MQFILSGVFDKESNLANHILLLMQFNKKTGKFNTFSFPGILGNMIARF